PAPTSVNSGVRSSTSTCQPRRVNASADASPAIPPPMMIALMMVVLPCSTLVEYSTVVEIELVKEECMSRRAELADAAIATLARDGMRGLTHRAVDRAAGLPEGSASYYFRTRQALLKATVERLAELDSAEMLPSTSLPVQSGHELDAFAAAAAAIIE